MEESQAGPLREGLEEGGEAARRDRRGWERRGWYIVNRRTRGTSLLRLELIFFSVAAEFITFFVSMGNSASSSTEYILPTSESLWTASAPPLELRPMLELLLKNSGTASSAGVLYVSVPNRSPTPQPGVHEAAPDAVSPNPTWSDALVLGHAALEVSGREAFFSSLHIAPEHRGKGHSVRFIAALRAHLASVSILHAWPRQPSEDSLEWARHAALSPSAAHLAAWLLLHGQAAGFPLPAQPSQPPLDFAQDLAALCAPGALPAMARAQEWRLTALVKAFSTFLAQACAFQEEHALAVGLLMGVELFGDDAGIGEGEGEGEEGGEAEEGEEEEEEEEEEEAEAEAEASVTAGLEGVTGGSDSAAAAADAAAAAAPPSPSAHTHAAVDRRGKRTYAAVASVAEEAGSAGAGSSSDGQDAKRQK